MNGRQLRWPFCAGLQTEGSDYPVFAITMCIVLLLQSAETDVPARSNPLLTVCTRAQDKLVVSEM